MFLHVPKDCFASSNNYVRYQTTTALIKDPIASIFLTAATFQVRDDDILKNGWGGDIYLFINNHVCHTNFEQETKKFFFFKHCCTVLFEYNSNILFTQTNQSKCRLVLHPIGMFSEMFTDLLLAISEVQTSSGRSASVCFGCVRSDVEVRSQPLSIGEVTTVALVLCQVQ